MKRIRIKTTLLILLFCLAAGCQPEPKEEPRQYFVEIDQVVKEEIAKAEVGRTEKAKPQQKHEELSEVQDLEKAIADNAISKEKIAQQDPIDYQDPSHRGYITPVVRRKVWIRNKGQCAACGSREDLQYDYIVPLIEGGNNTLNNLQLLCKTCNQEKLVK